VGYFLGGLEPSHEVVDPFARNFTIGTTINDLNPETNAQHHMDAIGFLQKLRAEGRHFDGAIYDRRFPRGRCWKFTTGIVPLCFTPPTSGGVVTKSRKWLSSVVT
jgi:hypothetical protein